MHFSHPPCRTPIVPICISGVWLCVWGNVGLCQTTALPFITNRKLYWTMIKCSPAQELIMSNSLSRPSWDHFSGPSWLPGAPWTSWNMWPQWLPPSLPLNPAEQFTPVRGQTSRSELIPAATEQEKGRPRCVWLTDLFCSLYDNIWIQSGFFFFWGGGFCCQVCFEFSFYFFFCNAVFLSYFLFLHPPYFDVMHSLSTLMSFKTMKLLCF